MSFLRLQLILLSAAFAVACTDTSFNGGTAERGGKDNGKDKKSNLAGPGDDGNDDDGNDDDDVDLGGGDDDRDGKTEGDDDDLGEDDNNGTGEDDVELSEEMIERCRTNPVEKPEEAGNVPALPDGNFKVGDMDRKKISGTETSTMLSKHVNGKCAENNSMWATYTPTVSGDKVTRDLVCKLYGYQQAGDAFGYFKRASPKNDWAGHWNASTKRYEINYDASKAPTNNINVLWTSCKGKIYDACKKEFMKNEFKCK